MKAINDTFSELLEFRVEEVVGSNVRRLIRESGFNTEYLSYRTNLSVPTINRLKAGQHLSIQGICALAGALNVDPLEFFQEA